MPKLVVQGAMVNCSGQFVPAPIPFSPTPGMVSGPATGAGTIADVAPGMNIPPTLGACKASANPAVVAAKAAGSPSAPCIFAPMGMWDPGASKVTINGLKALTQDSTLKCATAVGSEKLSFVSNPNTAVDVT